VSSVLTVVFESANGDCKEEIPWTEFLGHLASKRNPYFTLGLLPDESANGRSGKGRPAAASGLSPVYSRTPADLDGGSAPWFAVPFDINYVPTNKKDGKVVHTDVVRMGFFDDPTGDAQAERGVERERRLLQDSALSRDKMQVRPKCSPVRLFVHQHLYIYQALTHRTTFYSTLHTHGTFLYLCARSCPEGGAALRSTVRR
jgi:hypothetical protein